MQSRIKLFVLLLPIIICAHSLSMSDYPEQQLQKPQIIFTNIQQDNQINTHHHPQLSKLVFITPWNPSGKQLTIKYAHKLQYISPCWYELILKNNKATFQNDQLVDFHYLQQIKSANPSIKILPRVYLNNFEFIRHVASRGQHFQQLIQLIKSIFKVYQFDGLVFDSPYNLYVDDQQRVPLNNFMHQLTNQIKESLSIIKSKVGSQLLLFFNMANPSSQQKINTKLYQTLNVDALLIQNYDSPINFHLMIKNSIKWINKSKIKKSKIFLLLPFFSYKNGQGISTKDAKNQLIQDGVFSQGFQRGMCRFLSNKKRKYLVPCYKYFSQAYKLIQESGFEVGYWQGGNGLQNYYVFM